MRSVRAQSGGRSFGSFGPPPGGAGPARPKTPKASKGGHGTSFHGESPGGPANNSSSSAIKAQTPQNQSQRRKSQSRQGVAANPASPDDDAYGDYNYQQNQHSPESPFSFEGEEEDVHVRNATRTPLPGDRDNQSQQQGRPSNPHPNNNNNPPMSLRARLKAKYKAITDKETEKGKNRSRPPTPTSAPGSSDSKGSKGMSLRGGSPVLATVQRVEVLQWKEVQQVHKSQKQSKSESAVGLSPVELAFDSTSSEHDGDGHTEADTDAIFASSPSLALDLFADTAETADAGDAVIAKYDISSELQEQEQEQDQGQDPSISQKSQLSQISKISLDESEADTFEAESAMRTAQGMLGLPKTGDKTEADSGNGQVVGRSGAKPAGGVLLTMILSQVYVNNRSLRAICVLLLSSPLQSLDLALSSISFVIAYRISIHHTN